MITTTELVWRNVDCRVFLEAPKSRQVIIRGIEQPDVWVNRRRRSGLIVPIAVLRLFFVQEESEVNITIWGKFVNGGNVRLEMANNALLKLTHAWVSVGSSATMPMGHASNPASTL